MEALKLAAHPQPDSMKIVIQPGSAWAPGTPGRRGRAQLMGRTFTVTGKMTAAVLYGKEDIKIERVPIPRVGEGEVLVKVHVALTCGTDLKVYQRGYHARMIVPPALFGHELAGTIEQVGEGVRGFKKGMRVVALNSAPCGMCFYCSKHQVNLCEDLLFNNGAYAEYIRIPRRIVETNMLIVPSNVSFEDAAMTEPLACVLRGLHETGVEIGDTVAVIGGGPIGLMFVQVAKAIGCNVIAVVKRDSQVALARKKGAHEVVQITKVKDPVEAVRELSPERRGADVVIEAVGRPEAWEWAVQMVRKGGTVNFFGGCATGTKVQLDTNRLHYSEITLKATFHHTPETVRRAFGLIAEKKVLRHRLHYRRSAAFTFARCAAPHAEPQRTTSRPRSFRGTEVRDNYSGTSMAMTNGWKAASFVVNSCVIACVLCEFRILQEWQLRPAIPRLRRSPRAGERCRRSTPSPSVAPSEAEGARILPPPGALALREFFRRVLVSSGNLSSISSMFMRTAASRTIWATRSATRHLCNSGSVGGGTGRLLRRRTEPAASRICRARRDGAQV